MKLTTLAPDCGLSQDLRLISLGQASYPHATTLTITADSGGSNGSRGRLTELGA